MAAPLDGLEIVETPQSNTLTVTVAEPRRQRRRRKKHNRLQPSCQTHVDDLPERTNSPLPRYSKVVFDEDGSIKEALPMPAPLKETVNRKTKKRSSGFDMKTFRTALGPTGNADPTSSSPMDPMLDTCDLNNPLLNDPDIHVNIVKSQHLEVRVYRFPNTYESVVKYWYLNLHQLERMNHSEYGLDTYQVNDEDCAHMNESLNEIQDSANVEESASPTTT